MLTGGDVRAGWRALLAGGHSGLYDRGVAWG
jgi:hypothetical protein